MTGTTIILITMIMLGSCHGFSVSPKARGTKILQGSRTWGSTSLFAKVLPQDLDESIAISEILPKKLLKEVALEAEDCQGKHEEYETQVWTPPLHVPARQSSHNENQAAMVDESLPIDELMSDAFLKEIALDAEPSFNEHLSMVDDTIPVDELLPQAFFKEIALKAEGLRGREKQYENHMLTPPFHVLARQSSHNGKQAAMVDETLPIDELMSDAFLKEIALDAEPSFNEHLSMVDDTTPVDELLPQEFFEEIALEVEDLREQEEKYENDVLTPPFFAVTASKTGHSSNQDSSMVDDVPVEELLSDEFMTEIDLEAEQAAFDAGI
jgi:hypothetical protein